MIGKKIVLYFSVRKISNTLGENISEHFYVRDVHKREDSLSSETGYTQKSKEPMDL